MPFWALGFPPNGLKGGFLCLVRLNGSERCRYFFSQAIPSLSRSRPRLAAIARA